MFVDAVTHAQPAPTHRAPAQEEPTQEEPTTAGPDRYGRESGEPTAGEPLPVMPTTAGDHPAGPARGDKASLLQRWPGHVAALRDKARRLMTAGDNAAACRIWRSLLHSLPRDAEAWHHLRRAERPAAGLRDLHAAAPRTDQPPARWAAATARAPDGRHKVSHRTGDRLVKGHVVKSAVALDSDGEGRDAAGGDAAIDQPAIAPVAAGPAPPGPLQSGAAPLPARRAGRIGGRRQPAHIGAPGAGESADHLLAGLHAAGRALDAPALLAGLEQAVRLLPTGEVRDLVALHEPALLLGLRRGAVDEAERETGERRAVRLLRHRPGRVIALVRGAAEEGRLGQALRLMAEAADGQPHSHRHGAARSLAVSFEKSPAKGHSLAQSQSVAEAPLPAPDVHDGAALLQWCDTALPDWKGHAEAAVATGLILAGLGHHRDAVVSWRQAVALRPDGASWRGLLGALRAADDDDGLGVAVAEMVASDPALDARPPGEQVAIIQAMRHLTQNAQRSRSAAVTDRVAQAIAYQPSSRLKDWIVACAALARDDGDAALRQLDAALRRPALKAGSHLDLNAERALVHMRYHRYGEAGEALALASPVGVAPLYARRRRQLAEIAAFCPEAPAPLRFPECLIDVVMAEVAARPLGYATARGHLVMIAGSLGQGGGERQTQTVLRRLSAEPGIARLSLLVRSVHLRPGDDFFYASVRAMPIAHQIFGRDWARPSDIGQVLPELAFRPRLAQAIALMPHNLREDIIRLVRALWDLRPEAVHIWQDMHAAALACHIAGVPRFFIHRGSLSPDHWAQTPYQTTTHFRAMRHAYRRLLERPDFCILNNSRAGCDTDQAWTGWPAAEQFLAVPNAVDFAGLGRDTGRNLALRRRLGLADPATPLIGGAFRIEAVKRPLWWMEAARLILEAMPDANFLIIGDGDMAQAVRAFAADHGFADRLHLPGRVSNVGDWYRAMDIKLLTSEREGIPNAIIEAQHFSVPVVATDVGGVGEALRDGETGRVVRGDTPAAYAAAVIAILRDPTWRAAAGARAPAHVHALFSLDAVVAQLMRLYGLRCPSSPRRRRCAGVRGYG